MKQGSVLIVKEKILMLKIFHYPSLKNALQSYSEVESFLEYLS
jgi:hypothetical protein